MHSVPNHERDLLDLLSEEAARHGIPGAVLGVLRDGEQTLVAHGVANTRTGEPAAADTRFALGSLAKPLGATALALLAAEGRLTFDDPVAGHVPELRGAAWAQRATVRDLLANRSRVPLLEQTESPAEDASLTDLVADLAEHEGTAAFWSYANAGWCTAGRVLETVTGLPWNEALRTVVLAPLGLGEATFAAEPVNEPRAAGHAGTTPLAPWAPPALAPAGGTVLATVGDLLQLAQAHLEEPTLAPLREVYAEPRLYAWLDSWCLGWARFDWADGPVWGWDGLLPGHRSILRFDPSRRTAIALLTNGDAGRALYRSLFRGLAGMPELRLEPALGAADVERLAGTYEWPDRVYTATADGDTLVLEGDGRRVEALPLDERTFLVDPDDPDNPTVTFGDGVLYVMLWGLPRTVRG
jgi:CubicO group peptidase (beta-lactamase class C family)